MRSACRSRSAKLSTPVRDDGRAVREAGGKVLEYLVAAQGRAADLRSPLQALQQRRLGGQQGRQGKAGAGGVVRQPARPGGKSRQPCLGGALLIDVGVPLQQQFDAAILLDRLVAESKVDAGGGMGQFARQPPQRQGLTHGITHGAVRTGPWRVDRQRDVEQRGARQRARVRVALAELPKHQTGGVSGVGHRFGRGPGWREASQSPAPARRFRRATPRAAD